MNKTCSKCKKEKDISEFTIRNDSKSGFRSKCKTCTNVTSKIYHYKNRDSDLIRQYTNVDKKKKLVCNLTTEWFKENITNKSCAYCGDTKNLGCDRIDNSKGHTKDNVIPCCLICNKVRLNEFSIEEMHRIGLVIRQIKEERISLKNKDNI